MPEGSPSNRLRLAPWRLTNETLPEWVSMLGSVTKKFPLGVSNSL
jgi:hypothetical protein